MDLKVAMENYESEADMQQKLSIICNESDSNIRESSNDIGGLGIGGFLANGNVNAGDTEKWRFNARRRNTQKKDGANDSCRSREYGGIDNDNVFEHVSVYIFNYFFLLLCLCYISQLLFFYSVPFYSFPVRCCKSASCTGSQLLLQND